MATLISILVVSLVSLTNSQRVPGYWLSPIYEWGFQYPLPVPSIAEPKYSLNISGIEVEYFEVDIRPFTKQVYPNLGPAYMVGFEGVAPGPTFRVKRGTETIVRYTNHGNRTASTHLHGAPTRSPWDGWADDLVPIGSFKDYYYSNTQTARTLWYHDHANEHTAADAYFGQNGFWIIYDPEEDSLHLPMGNYDVPLGLSDALYQYNGDLVDPDSEKINFFGDVLQVNGQPWPYFSVEPRRYRFRVCDMALSRPFTLSFQDTHLNKIQFDVIGSDGGYFHNVVTTSDLTISMGERYDIVVDFTHYSKQNITLANGLSLLDIQNFDLTDKVMRFVVGSSVSDNSNNGPVPRVINIQQPPQPPARDTIDHVFNFQRTNDEWTINGIDYNETAARVLARPPQGTVENWQLRYASGPGVHPVHIHLIDYKIVSRSGGTRGLLPYEAAGMKDVVLLEPGEVVNVVAFYGPWNGQYMFHCHNLVHEDNEMMDVFNATLLEELGYEDWADFDDPMDPRFKPTPSAAAYFAPQSITETLMPSLASCGAYRNVASLSTELSSYYKTHTYGESTTSAFSTSAADPESVLTSVVGVTGSGDGVTGVPLSTSTTSTSTSATTTSISTSVTSSGGVASAGATGGAASATASASASAGAGASVGGSGKPSSSHPPLLPLPTLSLGPLTLGL